jgi:hypothetical protein
MARVGCGRPSGKGSWDHVRHLASLAMLVGLAGGLASCATPTSGQAVPENPAASTENGQPSTRPTSSPQVSGGPLADTDPCSLLDSAAKAKLGLSGSGEPRKIGVSRGCRWRLRQGTDSYIFDVGILPAGISNVPDKVQITKLPDIGSHQAAQTQEGGGAGTCLIILGVSESSRVDNTVSASGDTQKACELVMELAKQVEPKLP